MILVQKKNTRGILVYGMEYFLYPIISEVCLLIHYTRLKYTPLHTMCFGGYQQFCQLWVHYLEEVEETKIKKNMIQKIIRWILLIPITTLCFLFLPYVIEWILSLISNIIHFITTFGTWYYNNGEVRFLIVTKILSYLITGGLTGAIGGYIAPTGNSKVTSWLVGFTTVTLSALGIISNWNSVEWFVSLSYVIVFLISSAIAIGMANLIQQRKNTDSEIS